MDNCTAHKNMPDMSNIEIKIIPPNSTSRTQPLNITKIKKFQGHYRKELVIEYFVIVSLEWKFYSLSFY